MSPKDLPFHVLFLAKQVLGFVIQAAKELFLSAPPTCSHGKRSRFKNHTFRLASQGEQTPFRLLYRPALAPFP